MHSVLEALEVNFKWDRRPTPMLPCQILAAINEVLEQNETIGLANQKSVAEFERSHVAIDRPATQAPQDAAKPTAFGFSLN